MPLGLRLVPSALSRRKTTSPPPPKRGVPTKRGANDPQPPNLHPRPRAPLAPLLDRQPASVVAVSAAGLRCLVLRRADFQAVVGDGPSAAAPAPPTVGGGSPGLRPSSPPGEGGIGGGRHSPSLGPVPGGAGSLGGLLGPAAAALDAELEPVAEEAASPRGPATDAAAISSFASAGFGGGGGAGAAHLQLRGSRDPLRRRAH